MLVLSIAVDDRPEPKFLNRHVREQLCASDAEMWKNLGIELGIRSEALRVIEHSNHNVVGCCSAMFQSWCEKQTTASWRQLIEALRQLQLNYLASQIESKLTPASEASGVNPGNYTLT